MSSTLKTLVATDRDPVDPTELFKPSPTLETKLDHLRGFTTLPIAVGFGIKTAQQVKASAAFSDAVVVGSALVDLTSKQKDTAGAVQAASAFIAELAQGLQR